MHSNHIMLNDDVENTSCVLTKELMYQLNMLFILNSVVRKLSYGI